ncbi:MAG: hypothetical protein HKN88_05355 [Gammaproteobacteria bacterium]|nr:hypothetical protein [Gammaproteobacteria bacterium]
MNQATHSVKPRQQNNLLTGALFPIIITSLVIGLALVHKQPGEPTIMSLNAYNSDAVLLELDQDYRGPDSVESESLLVLRNQLRENPESVDLTRTYVEAALSTYRKTGDPRYYGYAKGALAKWWHTVAPPRELWLLRVRILQSNHEFRQAADDLQHYLKMHTKDVEAYIFLADIWRRLGLLSQARNTCLKIAILGRPTLAQICALEIRLSGGFYQSVLSSAEQLLNNASALAPTEQQWLYAVYAEAAVAAKNYQLARELYERSMEVGATDLVTRLHYADVLRELGQHSEVIELLSNESMEIPVLLRLSIATQKSKHAGDEYQKALEKQLNSPLLAPQDFLREKAMYQLYLQQNPVMALELAKQNWALQKAWEDAELLLLCARSVNDAEYSAIEQEIDTWRKQSNSPSIL